MRKTLSNLLWLALLLPRLGGGTEIAVGNAKIVIPAPVGFVPASPQMTNFDRLLESRVSPRNVCLASFVFNSAGALPQDSVAIPSRLLSVQLLKGSEENHFSEADFAGIKSALQKQNAETVSRFEQRSPGASGALTNDIHRTLLDRPVLRGLGNLPFPIHGETSNSIAFSSLVNFSARGADGLPEQRTGVFTATLLLVKNKILYLYAYGGEEDLEWSRKISRGWTAAITAANEAKPDSGNR